jgi:hypothetical protein
MTYSCDPLVGCGSVAKPVPLNTKCTDYKCISATGEIETTDLCPPQPQCVDASDCEDNNACTQDSCVLSDPSDRLSAKCVWVPIPPCNDNNACTYDSCNVTTGCQFEPVPEDICEDNNACTVDICDPTSLVVEKPCRYETVVCNHTRDNACRNTTCDRFFGCVTVDKVCDDDDDDNCTISYCNANSTTRTKSGKKKKLGCYTEKAGDCGGGIAPGAIGGLVAGVIAGIVVAAIAGALMLGGGAAYAFSQGAGSTLGAGVQNNPLYEADGSSGYNPLNTAQ